MKTKLLFLLFTTSFLSILKAQETPINLIAFQSLQGPNATSIIKWEVQTPENFTSIPTQVASILVGNSTFNSSTGDYIAKVNLSNSSSGILEFNTLNNSIEFNSESFSTNGSSECDMQTGNIYTYDNNSQNQKVFKKYTPATNEFIEIGTFNFPLNSGFYPDSSCFDSNLGIYYFVMSDSDGLKLVSVPVNNATFSYSEVLITGMPILGNIGLEFSNDSNTIFATFFTNFSNQNYVFNVGTISPLGVLASLATIPTISGLQLFNRSFDQATNSLIFVGSEQNVVKLFIYDTDTISYLTKPLPTGIINELECNNYAYSQAKYGQLNTQNFDVKNQILVNQNLKTISFSEDLLNKNFEIYSITGSKVVSQKVPSNLSFDFSNFSSGLYIIRFNNSNNAISKKLFLN